MDRYVDIPRAAPSSEILRAIAGTAPSPVKSADEIAEFIPAPNPWVVKAGETRVPFTDENEEERALEGPINEIKKLFEPKSMRTAPNIADLPVALEDPDAEERALYSPVRKLFYPGINDAEQRQAALAKSASEWNEPLTKSAATKPAPAGSTIPELTFKLRRDENGFVWRECFDKSGAMKSAMLVIDDEVASLEMLKARLDARLSESTNP